MDKNYQEALRRIQETINKNSTTLKLTGLSLTYIPNALKEFKGLIVLNLGYNQINDVSFLTNLINLSSLNLENNQIKDISLFKTLTSLNLVNIV